MYFFVGLTNKKYDLSCRGACSLDQTLLATIVKLYLTMWPGAAPACKKQKKMKKKNKTQIKLKKNNKKRRKQT